MKSKTRFAFRNPFLNPALAAAATVLAGSTAHAIDYGFGSITENFTITASDQARVLGVGITASGTLEANNGAVYDRGSDQDATYMHFNPLFSLAGTTINGDVNLNLTVNAQYGGAINNGIIGTAAGVWTTSSATPGITTFTPVTAPNATYNTNDIATWTISNATFTGTTIMGDLANFNGLGITAGDGSQAHFSALATLTGNYTGAEVRVYGATDWSAASWDNGTKTLSITGSSDVTGGNVALATGATLSLAGSATLDSGSFAGNFANSGTLAFGSSANQTLSGAISGSGALTKSGAGTLSLNAGGGDNNNPGVYKQNLTGGLSIQGGTVSLDSQFIRMGAVTVEDGGTLLATVPWATGSSNPWFNGRSIGSITVNAGGVLTTSSGINGIMEGLTLNGGTVSATSGPSADWGAFIIGSQVSAGGSTTSNITAELAVAGTQAFDVGADSILSISGAMHNRYAAAGAVTKTGPGTLSLSGDKTYSGGTYAQGGLLEISGGSSSISGMSLENGSVTFSGGTTTLSGGITTPNPFVSGNLVFGGNSVVTVGGILKLAALAIPSITIQDNADVTLQSGMQIGDWGNGIYLNGGTLRTPSLAASSQGWAYPGRWLHLDGTTVVATASNANFITMLNWDPTYNVAVGQTNGAIFDTNGNSVAITVNLVDESGQKGKLTKLGTGTLTLGGVNSYTGDTTVNGGSLQLLRIPVAASPVTITNAGFEAPDYSGGAWSYLGSDGVSGGWTITSGGIGSNTSPWVGTAPEGDQAGFLQNTASITQTITVSTAGYYDLSFQTANRPSYNASDIAVQIDASTLGQWTAAQLNTGGSFVSRSVPAIHLTAGTHTLTFSATQFGSDSATAIDNVTLTGTSFNGSLTFAPGADTDSNKITGSGAGAVKLDGEIYLNLSAADVANGNSWPLVDVANIVETYGDNFSVNSSLGAFTNNSGTWTRTDGDNTWTFDQSTGELTLAVASADPFEDWIGPFGVSDPLPGGDPDNDGLENLLEYVLKDGDPSISNPGILPTVNASGANLVFTYLRRTAATGTTQTFQYGSNLTGWTDVPVTNGGIVAITSPEAGIEQVVITVPKESNTKLFGRLQVVK